MQPRHILDHLIVTCRSLDREIMTGFVTAGVSLKKMTVISHLDIGRFSNLRRNNRYFVLELSIHDVTTHLIFTDPPPLVKVTLQISTSFTSL